MVAFDCYKIIQPAVVIIMTVNPNYSLSPATRIMYTLSEEIARAKSYKRMILLKDYLHIFMSEEEALLLLKDDRIQVELSPMRDFARITVTDKSLSEEQRTQLLAEIAEKLRDIIDD